MKKNLLNYFFVGAYDLKYLPDMLDLISQSLNVISGFEANIRSTGIEISVALSEAHEFVYQQNHSFFCHCHNILAKIVRKQITDWLLCHKSTEYDYILCGAFLFHNTRETRIDESARVC